MKKITKKILAVVLMLAMAVVAITGCSSASGAKTMFGVVKEAVALEKADFELVVDMNYDSASAKVTLSGTTDGNATTVNADIVYSGFTFKLNNVFVVTKDTVYLNVKEIASKLESVATLAGMDLSSTGINDYEWVKLSVGDIMKKDTTVIDTICDDFDTAFKNVIKKDKNTYTINVASADDAKALSEALVSYLTDNSKKVADLLIAQKDKTDVKATQKQLLALFNDVFAKAEALATDFTDEQKDVLESFKEKYSEMISEYGEEADDITADSVEEGIKKYIEEIKDFDLSDEDCVNAKLTVAKDKNTYTISTEVVDADNYTANVKAVITANNKASVTVPDNATEITDILAKYLVKYVESYTQTPVVYDEY